MHLNDFDSLLVENNELIFGCFLELHFQNKKFSLGNTVYLDYLILLNASDF